MGPAIVEAGDLHGDAVNVAARVEASANGDEIVVSESVVKSCGEAEVEFFAAPGPYSAFDAVFQTKPANGTEIKKLKSESVKTEGGKK